ncbi:MAG: hypothetical protein K8S27_12450 [Candidatus Omnitrophica bacterium]|nr:hypothetical protein [Candidatus Omnitrophota bacterium]
MERIKTTIKLLIFLCAFVLISVIGLRVGTRYAEAQCATFRLRNCQSGVCGCGGGGFVWINQAQTGSTRPYLPARYVALCARNG